MNKRLKRNWEGSGGEGGRDIKREKQERKEREEEEKNTRKKKKGLTDSAHAAQHAAAEGTGRRSAAPPLLYLLSNPRCHPRLPLGGEQRLPRKGKEPIMSWRQRSVSPWLFIGLPERWTLCSLRGFISTFSPSPSALSGLWQAGREWDVEELAENLTQQWADRFRCEDEDMGNGCVPFRNPLIFFFFCYWRCISWQRDHGC